MTPADAGATADTGADTSPGATADVRLRSELPLNASGKVLKHVLRQQFARLDPDTVTQATG